MSTQQLRIVYTKITLWFYLGWVIIFVLEGLYAQTLPGYDLTSTLDRLIPVLPQFVWFYLLCYVFPLVLIPVTTDWHRFNIALLSVAVCTFLAFIFHIGVPIAFSRPQLGDSLSERMLRYLYLHDFKPGAQNFPSLHVAISWIVCFACFKQGRPKFVQYILLIMALLIIASTVFIKQHLLIDLIGGTVLAFVVWKLMDKAYYRLIPDSEAPLTALRLASKRTIPPITICIAFIVVIVGIRLLGINIF